MNTTTLTVIEAARVMGCGRSRVFALIASGELPSFRIGRERRVRREDVEALIARAIEREREAREEVAGRA